MHKMIVLIGETTEPGTSGEAQWHAHHVKTALALKGLRRMVRNDVQEAVRRDHAAASTQPLAIVEELWFDTEPVMDELVALLRPTANLAVLQASSVREHVVFRRPVGDKPCLKRVSLLQRSAGTSPGEFSNYGSMCTLRSRTVIGMSRCMCRTMLCRLPGHCHWSSTVLPNSRSPILRRCRPTMQPNKALRCGRT